MKISIIIPTFNRSDIVRILLQSLRDDAASRSVAELEVIVANDRSTDDTQEMLTREFPEITVVMGPGKNAELAKRTAIEVATGDFLVMLDDDALPRPGWIVPVLDAIGRGEQIIQSKIIFLDQGQTELNDETLPHFHVGWKWNSIPVAVLYGGYRPQYLPIAHEFGLFVSRQVLARVPLDDSNLRFDHQGEAASFYLRASQLGYKVYFEPRAIIDHLGALHGGCKERDQKAGPKKNCTPYAIGMVRNMIVLARMRRLMKLPLLVVYYLAAGLYLSVRQKKNCFRYFYQGVVQGLTHKFVPVTPYQRFS